MAVLERCLAGNLLEDAVESLVGRETAERDGICDSFFIRTIAGIAEYLLCVLHAVARYVLGETESSAAVDTLADIGAVAMYGGSQVMNSQIRRGEQFLFAKNGSYRLHQRIGFFYRSFLSLRGLRMDGFLWKGGMRRYIADTEQQCRHNNRRYANHHTLGEEIPSQEVETHGKRRGDTQEVLDQIGGMEKVTTVIRIDVIQPCAGLT